MVKTKVSRASSGGRERWFVLTDVSALQVVLSSTVKTTKKPVTIDAQESETLPQTVVPGDEDDVPITDILQERSKRLHLFFDERKNTIKCWPVMIDHTIDGLMPTTTTRPCWWCRASFTTRPIGCPLKYTPLTGIERSRVVPRIEAMGLTPTEGAFETEGMFCSFPCCKAYIIEQRQDVKYKDSLGLLGQLYTALYDKRPEYPIAPSWKLIDTWGGHLTIQQYRASFTRVEYEETINIRRPYIFCSSQYLAERKIKPFRGGGLH